jgi:hypothetical protein
MAVLVHLILEACVTAALSCRAVAYIRPPQTPRRGMSHWSGGIPYVQDIKIFLCSFKLDTFLLKEGIILDPCYEIWE